MPPSQLFGAISWHRMNLKIVYDSMTWVWDMQIPVAPHTKPKETHSLLFPHLLQEEHMLPTARFPQIWWIMADMGGRGGTPGQVL